MRRSTQRIILKIVGFLVTLTNNFSLSGTLLCRIDIRWSRDWYANAYQKIYSKILELKKKILSHGKFQKKIILDSPITHCPKMNSKKLSEFQYYFTVHWTAKVLYMSSSFWLLFGVILDFKILFLLHFYLDLSCIRNSRVHSKIGLPRFVV